MNFDLRRFVHPENEDSGDEQMKGCEEDIGTVGSFFPNPPVDAEAIPGSVTLRTAALARQLMVRLRPGHCFILAWCKVNSVGGEN